MRIKELKQKLKKVINEEKEKINIDGFIIDKNIAMKLLYGNLTLILKKGDNLTKKVINYKNLLKEISILKKYQQTKCNVIQM